MGCTSSAPNMTPSLTPSEKDLKLSETDDMTTMMAEKEINIDKQNESNRIQVLPTCDTLGESTHLDRNNKSLEDLNSLDLEKGSHANGHIVEGDNDKDTDLLNTDLDNKQTDEKLSSLEEVVEKVVELYVDNSTTEGTQNETNTNKDTNEKAEEEKVDEGNEKQQDENEANVIQEAKPEEATSPSQSQSSRATRWEALADIAAELPPSLAVDPVTGQIYSLSK